MKRIFTILCTLCVLVFAQAETVTRSFYFDFGNSQNQNTVSPDVYGHHWNNISGAAANATANIIDATGASTQIVLTNNSSFSSNGNTNGGGLLSPSADLLGDLAIATATQDYFFASKSNHCTFSISGLDKDKGYQFKIFGSRNATDVRVADYTLRGQWAIQGSLQVAGTNLGGTGVNQNNSSVYLSPVIRPAADGTISLTVHRNYADINQNSNETPKPEIGPYFPINCMRMQEMTNLHVADKEMYIDCGHNDGTNGELTTSPDAGDIYWNNLYENGTSAAAVNLVYSNGTSTGANVTITSAFSHNGYKNGGNTADTYSALLGAFGKKTVMGDYFHVGSSSTGKMKFSGLNPDKAYVFYIIGSRAYNSGFGQTVAHLVLEGWTNCTFTNHTGGNGLCYSGASNGWNEDAFSVSEPIFPTEAGEMLLSLSAERGSYVHINGIRIEEYSDYVKPTPPTVLMKGTAVENSPVTMFLRKVNSSDDASYETFCRLTNGGTLSLETDAAEVLSSGTCELETGIYRIVYSTASKTFESLKINRVGLVGNVTNAGWNAAGDELTYQGDGVWSATLNLPAYTSGSDAERGQFCLNSSWDYAIKSRNGQEGVVGFSPDAADCGYELKDIYMRHGRKLVTLDMQNFTYSIECADGIADNRITFFGSSVCRGEGASEVNYLKHGYAWQYAQLLAARHEADNSLTDWEYSNTSIGGNNTKNLLARYKGHMYGDCGKYVLIGLGLGNEGLHGAANQQGIYDQWKTNMAELISLAEAEDKVVVATSNYPRGDYNATDYAFVKQMNLEMHEWDIPTANFLGALDNCQGNGQWAEGYQNGTDIYHPTEAGHTEFMHTIVPSLFDALAADKAKPTRQTGNGLTLEEGQAILFTPEDQVHPFTLAFRVKDISALNLELSVSEGTVPALPTLPSDDSWHTIFISHYYAAAKTFIYLDGELQGSATDGRILLSGVSIGGECSISDLHFWRSGMNADEVAAFQTGKMLCSSLELYCPLNSSSLTNLAQSTNTIRLDGQRFVAGNCEAFGSWSAPDAVEMTNKQVLFKDLPEGWYEFKVTDGTWDNTWGYTEVDATQSSPMYKTYDGANNNICFRLQQTCDVTIKMVNNKVVLLIDREYCIVGNGSGTWLNGQEWGSRNDNAKLDEHFSRTYYNLPAGDYRFKVKENLDDAWNDDCTWGYAHFDNVNSNAGGDWDGNDHNVGFHLDRPSDVTIALVNNLIRLTVSPIYFIAGNGDAQHGTWCNQRGWWQDEPDSRLDATTLSKTYTALPAGEYEFKLTNGRWPDNGGTEWAAQDVDPETSSKGYIGNSTNSIKFHLQAPTDVTVSFNPETNKISLVSSNGYFVCNTYSVVGAEALIGYDWDKDETTTEMTRQDDGTFTYTINGKHLETGDYQYKIIGGHSWGKGCEYPNTNAVLSITRADTYTIVFTLNPATAEQTCTAIPPGEQVTISAYQFSTFYSDKAYILPEGLQAWIFTGVEGDMLTMQAIDLIPANTGVVLYGAASETYTLLETTTDVTYPANLLKGTTTDTKINNSCTHYILGVYNGDCGLFWPSGTDEGKGAFTNAAGKAYLELGGATPAPARIRGFVLSDHKTPTAVEDVREQNNTDVYYDILGRQVRNPQQGGIYIRGGKKVIAQ